MYLMIFFLNRAFLLTHPVGTSHYGSYTHVAIVMTMKIMQVLEKSIDNIKWSFKMIILCSITYCSKMSPK